jgi:hypothetical protein
MGRQAIFSQAKIDDFQPQKADEGKKHGNHRHGQALPGLGCIQQRR